MSSMPRDLYRLMMASTRSSSLVPPSNPLCLIKANSSTSRIIFVHGLFGHPEKTWAARSTQARSKSLRKRSGSFTGSQAQVHGQERRSIDTQRSYDSQADYTGVDTTFWPRDLLPYVIHDVRIFTWGYGADIDRFGSASQSTINEHAGTLLSDIKDQQEVAECYRRPILFVAHSLGGIVVKAALNKSSATQGTRLMDIAPTTFGICFLGTPHRGSKSASLGKIAYQTTVAVTRRPNLKLLQGLERNSVELEHIGDGFAQTLLKYGPGLQIYSFREEKETRRYLLFNTMVRMPILNKV